MSEFTTDDLTKINAAIASGTLKVRTSTGREIQYQSISEMMTARDLIRADLGVAQADTRQRASRLSFTTSKGL
jgi:hypothetical protein